MTMKKLLVGIGVALVLYVLFTVVQAAMSAYFEALTDSLFDIL